MAQTDYTRLLTDNRLSEQARIIGFWVLNQDGEDGWVETRFDDVRPLLYGFPSDDVIRKHLRMLRGAGWAERRAGGRGHGDSYRIIDPLSSNPIHIDPPESGSNENIDREISGSKSDRPARERAYGGTVGGREKNEGEEREKKAAPAELSPRAEKAVSQHEEKLAGCRGALRDYLRDRVATPARQYAYVQKIAGWLDGLDRSVWMRPDGRTIAPEDWTGILADALNDLAASDESRMKRPVGDPANLRTKIDILVKQRYRRESGGSRTGQSTEGLSEGDRKVMGMRERLEEVEL